MNNYVKIFLTIFSLLVAVIFLDGVWYGSRRLDNILFIIFLFIGIHTFFTIFDSYNSNIRYRLILFILFIFSIFYNFSLSIDFIQVILPILIINTFFISKYFLSSNFSKKLTILIISLIMIIISIIPIVQIIVYYPIGILISFIVPYSYSRYFTFCHGDLIPYCTPFGGFVGFLLFLFFFLIILYTFSWFFEKNKNIPREIIKQPNQ